MQEKKDSQDSFREKVLDEIAIEEKKAGDVRVKEFIKANRDLYIDSSTGEVDRKKLEQELNAFVIERLKILYGEENVSKAKISMQITPLPEIEYEKLKTDESLYGQYTINPETAGMNHKEKEPRVKILDMKEFIGKPRSEVMKAVVEKYGGQYHIPGLEYEKYLLENPDKVPSELKTEGKLYYFMGSTFYGFNGSVNIPCVSWFEKRYSKLDYNTIPLEFMWGENDCIVLLEK